MFSPLSLSSLGQNLIGLCELVTGRRRNAENGEVERGGGTSGNLHVRLMWDESESGCSPAASSDVTTTTTGNEEYSSVQAVYGSVPSIRNLDETPMDNWTVG